MSQFPKALQRASTPNVSDVLGSLQVLHPAVKPVDDGMEVLGRAFTVKAYPGSIISVHKALTEAGTGEIVVVDGEGDITGGALFGEIMAVEAAARGIGGIVIDGPVRDVGGIAEAGFPVFCRAVTPRVGTNRRLGATQVPISCAGVRVDPGDVVMADDNGVVVIPAAQVDGIAGDLENLAAKEEALVDGIERGEWVADALGFTEKFAEE